MQIVSLTLNARVTFYEYEVHTLKKAGNMEVL